MTNTVRPVLKIPENTCMNPLKIYAGKCSVCEFESLCTVNSSMRKEKKLKGRRKTGSG